MTIDEVFWKHGIINGFSVKSNPDAIRTDIYAAMKEYAEEKCKEQRELCGKELSYDDCGDENFRKYSFQRKPNFD